MPWRWERQLLLGRFLGWQAERTLSLLIAGRINVFSDFREFNRHLILSKSIRENAQITCVNYRTYEVNVFE